MAQNSRMPAVAGLVALAALVVGIVVTGGDDEPVASIEAGADPTVEISGGTDSPTTVTEPTVSLDLPDRGLHPDLRDIDGWLQSDVSSLEELQGQVVAVQFWTFGCRNCKNTLPHMQDLYRQYHDQGLEIVGIHSPEFSYEAEIDAITEAAVDLGIDWPIVLDTEKRTFHWWQEGRTAHWPRVYLLDRRGHVRYDHIGEGRYSEIDAAVQALLAEDL